MREQEKYLGIFSVRVFSDGRGRCLGVRLIAVEQWLRVAFVIVAQFIEIVNLIQPTADCHLSISCILFSLAPPQPPPTPTTTITTKWRWWRQSARSPLSQTWLWRSGFMIMTQCLVGHTHHRSGTHDRDNMVRICSHDCDTVIRVLTYWLVSHWLVSQLWLWQSH